MTEQGDIAQIIAGCKTGNRKDQSALYQQYVRGMYQVAKRITGDAAEAEDVLQHAFVKVFRSINTYDGQSTIGAWIKRIVVNQSIDALRKRKLQFVELQEEIQPVVEEVAHESNTWQVSKLKEALNQLSVGYRTIVNLYVYEGYDHQEIASILNISEGTSKSQYARAKNRLRLLMEN